MITLDQASELLTVREAADYLKVSPVTVKRYLRQGRLRGIHLSARAVRIRRSDLNQFLAPTGPEEIPTQTKEPRIAISPPSPEELARRQAVVERVLSARQGRVIAPMTTAELVHLAREDATWYER